MKYDRQRANGRIWAIGLAMMTVCLAVGQFTWAQADEPSASSANTLKQWVTDLDSDVYAVRESATRNLVKAGGPAITVVTAAASSDSLEVTSRAIRILRQLCDDNDTAISDAAEAALQQLSTLKGARVAAMAADAIQFHHIAQQERATLDLQKLGVEIQEFIDPMGTQVVQVVVPNTWTGTDDDLARIRFLPDVSRVSFMGARITDGGLAHLRRLNKLSNLDLLGTDVTDAGVKDLAKALPNLKINRRSALLGVVGGKVEGGDTAGCPILGIQPMSAAEAADLRVGDLIVSFGDKPVSDFESLTSLIATKKPGDTVAIEVLRGGRGDGHKLTKEVVLRKWQ